MIDWLAVAKQLGFADEKDFWTEFYSDSRTPLPDLAKRFGTTVPVIKAALASAGIPRRSRGGANNLRFPLFTATECALIRAEGVGPAAKRLNVRYWHLHARLKRSEAALNLPSSPDEVEE